MVHSRSAFAAVALILALVASSSAQAQRGEKVGTLTCRLAPSIGLIIGSQQRMACRFQPSNGGPSEAYSGGQNRIGLDIGIPLAACWRGVSLRKRRRRSLAARWQGAMSARAVISE